MGADMVTDRESLVCQYPVSYCFIGIIYRSIDKQVQNLE